MFEVVIIKRLLIVYVFLKSTMCDYWWACFVLFCFVLPEAMAENDLQPPNYYEVMEFDPLAPVVTTE